MLKRRVLKISQDDASVSNILQFTGVFCLICDKKYDVDTSVIKFVVFFFLTRPAYWHATGCAIMSALCLLLWWPWNRWDVHKKVSVTLTCLRASSGGKFVTLPICVSTQALTAALESLYCSQSLTACWYFVQRASNSALVSSHACTASLTAASTLAPTSSVQHSRKGSAAAFNSPIRTSRAPKSPLRPCEEKIKN